MSDFNLNWNVKWRKRIFLPELGWRKQMIVYVGKSCLACPATRSWGNSIRTTISSVLLISNGTSPLASWSTCTGQTLCSVNPYLCPNLGLCAQSRSQNWRSNIHCFAHVWWMWSRILHLRISLFCKQESNILIGPNKLSCLIERKERNLDDWQPNFSGAIRTLPGGWFEQTQVGSGFDTTRTTILQRWWFFLLSFCVLFAFFARWWF